MPARKISFLNCKGGVGKTSLAVNVAAALAKEEKQNVLLVDLDAQCNASIWLMGIPRWLPLDGMLNRTVCAFFKTKCFLSGAVHKSVLEIGNPTRKALPRLDLIPAVYELLDLDHGPERKAQFPITWISTAISSHWPKSTTISSSIARPPWAARASALRSVPRKYMYRRTPIS